MRNPLPRATNHMLSMMGLQRRRSAASYLLPMLGLGMLTGAGLGLMLAPRKGVETRAEIANRARGFGGRVAEVAGTVARKIKRTARVAGSEVDEIRDSAYTSAPNGVGRVNVQVR